MNALSRPTEADRRVMENMEVKGIMQQWWTASTTSKELQSSLSKNRRRESKRDRWDSLKRVSSYFRKNRKNSRQSQTSTRSQLGYCRRSYQLNPIIKKSIRDYTKSIKIKIIWITTEDMNYLRLLTSKETLLSSPKFIRNLKKLRELNL